MSTPKANRQYTIPTTHVIVGDTVGAILPNTKRSISSGAAPVGNAQGEISNMVFMAAVITPIKRIGVPQEEARG